MIYQHNNILLVVIQKRAINFEIDTLYCKIRYELSEKKNNGLIFFENFIDIPDGNYSIIGKLEDITEEQAKRLTIQYHLFKEWWKNWQSHRTESWCTSALYSLNYLIASLSIPLTETQTILILKKIT